MCDTHLLFESRLTEDGHVGKDKIKLEAELLSNQTICDTNTIIATTQNKMTRVCVCVCVCVCSTKDSE